MQVNIGLLGFLKAPHHAFLSKIEIIGDGSKQID